VQLKPGERVVIDYDLHTVPGQPDTPVLRVTSVTFGKNSDKSAFSLRLSAVGCRLN
jgi:hypothetical protein